MTAKVCLFKGKTTPPQSDTDPGAITFDAKVAYLLAQGAVFRAFDFNNTLLDTQRNGLGFDYGTAVNDPSVPFPATDHSDFSASGHNSILMTVFSEGNGSPKSGAGSGGQWWGRFSNDYSVLYGAGATFYTQFMMKMDTNFVNNAYTSTGGGQAFGWKTDIVSAGDHNSGEANSTNTDIEIVGVNQYLRGVVEMYSHDASGNSTAPFNSGNPLELQPGKDGAACYYNSVIGNPPPVDVSHCVTYASAANQWVTVTTKIIVGSLVGNVYHNTRVQRWWSIAGATAVKVIDFTFDILCDPSGTEVFGKIWMLPYHTSKDVNQVLPTAHIRYANVIVSNTAIPMSTADPVTQLEILAASMAPGTWADLTGTNTAAAMTGAAGDSSLFCPYAGQMAWDSVLKRSHFVGSDHDNTGQPIDVSIDRHCIFDSKTNQWIWGCPSYVTAFGITNPWPQYIDAHGYFCTAIDSARRKLWRNIYGSSTFWLFDLDQDDTTDPANWTTFTLAAYDNPSGVINTIVAHEALDAIIWTTSGGNIWEINRATRIPTLIASGIGNGSWCMAAYDPFYKKTYHYIVGRIYTYGANRVLTRLGDLPSTLQTAIYDVVSNGSNGTWWTDPLNGDLYLVTGTHDGRRFMKMTSPGVAGVSDSVWSTSGVTQPTSYPNDSGGTNNVLQYVVPECGGVLTTWANRAGPAGGMVVRKGTPKEFA